MKPSDTGWTEYSDSQRTCLECHYRWPIEDLTRLTDESACPMCGTAVSVVEASTPAWDADEKLAKARLEIDIHTFRTPGGVSMGWIKDEVDKLLASLIAGGADTSASLSGAPAGEYRWIHAEDGFHTVQPLDDGIGSSQSGPDEGDQGGSITDFLNSLLGRRAEKARGVFIPWVEEEHKN